MHSFVNKLIMVKLYNRNRKMNCIIVYGERQKRWSISVYHSYVLKLHDLHCIIEKNLFDASLLIYICMYVCIYNLREQRKIQGFHSNL